jgi:hypothetical protein
MVDPHSSNSTSQLMIEESTGNRRSSRSIRILDTEHQRISNVRSLTTLCLRSAGTESRQGDSRLLRPTSIGSSQIWTESWGRRVRAWQRQ